MADLSDVSTALGQLIGTTLYPSGASGEAASPVAGLPVRVEAGWPSPQSLDDAMATGKAHVSIYPRPAERNTTRYERAWQQQSLNPATYTLTGAGYTITVGGVAPSTYYPQNLAAFVSGKPYVVTASTGQTAAQLATALGALIVVDWPGTTVVGAAITIPAPGLIGALRVGATGISIREIRRQEREFQIGVWAPSPAARDAVTKPIDAALAALSFITLADGTAARLTYKSTLLTDFDQRQAIWRRDLIYHVEYATTQTETDTVIVVEQQNLDDQFGTLLKTTYS